VPGGAWQDGFAVVRTGARGYPTRDPRPAKMGASMDDAPASRTSGHPTLRRRHLLLVVLAGTSGALDAFGFLALGGVFASVMTGNLVLLGLGAGTRTGGLAAHAAVAIGAYATGVLAGAWTSRGRHPSDGAGWSRQLQLLVVIELVLVAAVALVWQLVPHRASTGAQLALVAVAAGAMGLQSATVRVATGNGLSTTYLTGTLTGVAMAVVDGRRLRDELEGLSVLGAALLGAGVAGAAVSGWSAAAPLVPVALLVVVLLIGRTLVAGGSPASPTV